VALAARFSVEQQQGELTMKPTLLAATVLGGLACSMPARATLIEYQFSLSIIAAAGGGTMTGDFNYDAVTNLESNVSITIAGNAFGSGSSLDVTYTQVAPIAPPATTPFFNTASDIIIGKNGAAEAFLGFTAPLTPVGGEILLYGAVNASDTGFQQSSTDGLGLFATPVTTTEPASLAVLGVGLVGLSAKRRRRATPAA
jgi:hypothetical protein